MCFWENETGAAAEAGGRKKKEKCVIGGGGCWDGDSPRLLSPRLTSFFLPIDGDAYTSAQPLPTAAITASFARCREMSEKYTEIYTEAAYIATKEEKSTSPHDPFDWSDRKWRRAKRETNQQNIRRRPFLLQLLLLSPPEEMIPIFRSSALSGNLSLLDKKWPLQVNSSELKQFKFLRNEFGRLI